MTDQPNDFITALVELETLRSEFLKQFVIADERLEALNALYRIETVARQVEATYHPAK